MIGTTTLLRQGKCGGAILAAFGLCVGLAAATSSCSGTLFLDPEGTLGTGDCTDDSDCSRGVCRRGRCVVGNSDRPDGTDCEAPSQCTGNYCNAGTCASEPPDTEDQLDAGETCTQDEDCKSDDCETFEDITICTATCTDVCPGEGLACFNGQCVPRDYCENPDGQGNGPGCDENVNICDTCDTNATCAQVDGEFDCLCNYGYEGNGSTCERDECVPDPCQNDGVCTDGDGDYSCECEWGFEGKDCDVQINDCPPLNPCLNDGSCIDGVGTYSCWCTPAWTGDLCEIDVDECLNLPCLNGSTCINEDGGYTCDCLDGWMGLNCDFNVNDCPLPNPCQNGGTCVDGVGGYTCDCIPGFDGGECENNIDDCTPNPCLNSGTCTDAVNGYSCACPLGWGGSDCEDFADCTIDLQCDVDQFCDVGGTDKCSPMACVPNEKRCQGLDVVRCEGNGSGEVLQFNCPGRPGYYDSACYEPAPGDATCSCQDDWDCAANTVCEVDQCTGTGQPPTCSLPPEPFTNVLPTNEITWGGTQADHNATGSPFPASAQVVQSPIVANLDDDNGDGLIDEKDFPEIIFATFCNSAYTTNGTLRAIHGGGPDKGADYFASCGATVWHEGDAIGMACACSAAVLDPTTSMAVGDLDYDGIPEILSVTEGNNMNIYDNTGELIVSSPNYSWNGGPNPAVSIANLDNAGFAEIITGSRVLTIEHDAGGNIVFLDMFNGSSTGGRHNQGPISCVADLLGDERLEIIGGAAVYSFPRPPVGATSQADCGAFPPSTAEETAFCNGTLPIEWNGNQDGYCAVADVLGVDQTLPPGRDNPLDGLQEVVLIDDGVLRVFNGQDGTEHVTTSLGLGTRGGAPNVDDFDGDGFPEIGTAFQLAYAVMDLQTPTVDCPAWNSTPANDTLSCESANSPRSPPGTPCITDADCGGTTSGFACNEQNQTCICEHNTWRRITQDDSSRVTGSSVFDFNGDGAAEVIYNDECKFRIYDGVNGDVYFSEPSESRTRIEYPIVADVDNDGNAEIVFGVSNESGFCGGDTPAIEATYNNGLEVWGDANDFWVSARRIWNQHSYHITNITEGGMVPLYEPKGWHVINGRTYNNYRSNPRAYGIAPDLKIDAIQIAASGGGCLTSGTAAIIAVKIKNDGDLRVGPGVQLALYGDWGVGEVPLLDGGGAPLLATVGNTLEPQDVIFLSIDYDATDNGEVAMPTNIRVEIDSADQERECDEGNNEAVLDLAGGGNQGAELRLELGPVQASCDLFPIVEATVFNDGNLPVTNVVVRFYAGDPDQGGSLLKDVVFPGPIAGMGGSETLYPEISPVFPYCLVVQVFAVVNPDNAVVECNDGNNKATQTDTTFCCSG